MRRLSHRALINTVFLILALLPFTVTDKYFRWPTWLDILVSFAFLFGASAHISYQAPRGARDSATFTIRLARAVFFSLCPVAALAGAYALCSHLGSGQTVASAAAFIAAAITWFSLMPASSVSDYVDRVIRGRAQPASINGADIRLPRPASDPGLLWGGVKLPSRTATSHFMVVGTTGSGKTLTIRILLQDALRTIGTGADHRALIYDAKQDLVSQLAGMGLDAPIFTLNPFDRRCLAWDIAQDVTDPAIAFHTATLLMPQDPNTSQPFFVDAAQSLLYGVLLAFMDKGTDWTFGDVIRALQSTSQLRSILESTGASRPIAERFFGNRETLSNIMSTVATKSIVYEPIAAMWDKAYEQGRKISIRTWLTDQGKDNSILILGNSERARKPLDAINRVIFQRVTELILDQPENQDGTRMTWVVLDEVSEAGRLDGLSSLLTKGRSKGACVVLGFQDIDSLNAIYGEKTASALTGQCNNKAILRLESPATAAWASRLFGSYEAIEYRRSYQSGSSSGYGGGTTSHSTTVAEQYVNRAAVLDSQFYLIPLINPVDGLTGYYITPLTGAYYHSYPYSWLFGAPPSPLSPEDPGIMTPAPDVADLDPRDPGDLWLRRLVASGPAQARGDGESTPSGDLSADASIHPAPSPPSEPEPGTAPTQEPATPPPPSPETPSIRTRRRKPTF